MSFEPPTYSEQALAVVAQAQWDGVTYKELLDSGQYDGQGHGSASAVLTRLHKHGLITRLVEQRDNCSVYILPKYLAGRDHVPARSYTNEAREERADIDTVWATLGQIATCTCDCTCGARARVFEGLAVLPDAVRPEQADSLADLASDRTSFLPADDEERMMLEWAG